MAETSKDEQLARQLQAMLDLEQGSRDTGLPVSVCPCGAIFRTLNPVPFRLPLPCSVI